MNVRCPNCLANLDIVADLTLEEDLSCPSCGRALDTATLGEETISLSPTIPKRVAQFELLEIVGQGAFGTVWKARDSNLERFVALKIPRHGQFDSSTLVQFTKEAQAAAQMKHPHIVGVYAVGEAERQIYIASEFIDGKSLRERMLHKRYEFRGAAKLVLALAKALHVAHEAGIVHRDLKPGNVLIDAQGEPHVTDFGLAKRDTSEITVTAAGQVLGTAAYMSPEQAKGDGYKADRRSDIYSLGVILYELLCGERPFTARESRQLLHQVQYDEPESPRKRDRKVPRDLETICMKAVQKEPERRYATAALMAEDLQRYLDNKPITARPVSRVEKAWRWSRRNPAIALSVTVACVALTALVLQASILPGLGSPAIPTTMIELDTVPSGASVVFHPLDPVSGEPHPEQSIAAGVSPIKMKLPVGDYLVVAVAADGAAFHEVLRRVPMSTAPLSTHRHSSWKAKHQNSFELYEINIPQEDTTEGMVRFDGSPEFLVGSAAHPVIPPHRRSVPAFYIDTREYTVGELKSLAPSSGIFNFYKQYDEPIVDTEALAFLSWDDAVSLAEKLGKRLPDEFEFEFAATGGGSRVWPWGNEQKSIESWPFTVSGQPEWDATPTSPPVQGLFSNVGEWTSSWPTIYPAYRNDTVMQSVQLSDQRIVRGITQGMIANRFIKAEVQTASVRNRVAVDLKTWNRSIGLRLARSVKPRLKPEDFSREIAKLTR